MGVIYMQHASYSRYRKRISPLRDCTEWPHQTGRKKWHCSLTAREEYPFGNALIDLQCLSTCVLWPQTHHNRLHIIAGYSTFWRGISLLSFWPPWPKSGRKFYFIHAGRSPPNSHKGPQFWVHPMRYVGGLSTCHPCIYLLNYDSWTTTRKNKRRKVKGEGKMMKSLWRGFEGALIELKKKYFLWDTVS